VAIIGAERVFYDKHRFSVEIPGFDYVGFAKCSELKATAALRKHYEGGGPLPHKGVGRFDTENITLERGATRDLDLYTWFDTVASLTSGTGMSEPHFKRNISLAQLSRTGATLMRWHIYGAFPIEFVAGEWDAASDEVVITKVVLALDRFEPQLDSAANDDKEMTNAS
jgi:phage tail-like protein